MALSLIATSSHLGGAARVARQWLSVNPGEPVAIVVPDGKCPREESRSLVLRTLEDVGFPNSTDARFFYNPFELSAAAKPYGMLKQWEATQADWILHLDADMLLFGNPADFIGEVPEDAQIILTPHLLAPRWERDPPIHEFLCRGGVFNSGFVAVRRSVEAKRFLSWWAHCLEFGSCEDNETGLFVDQKFLDQTPALFEGVYILKRRRFNVGHWVMPDAEVRESDGIFQVDGDPLVIFHYTKMNNPPPDCGLLFRDLPYRAENFPAMRKLCVMACELMRNERLAEVGPTYDIAHFQEGTPILKPTRRFYRECVMAGRAVECPFESPALMRWQSTHAVKSMIRTLVPKSMRYIERVFR